MTPAKPILEVSDQYASLEKFDEDKGEMTFMLSYKVDLSSALKAGALKVKVSVYSKPFPEPPKIPGPGSTISDHLTYAAELEKYNLEVKKTLLLTTYDDLTSYMSNQAISTGDVSLITPIRKLVAVPLSKVISTKGEVVSKVIDSSNVDYSGVNKQRLMLDLMLKEGIDPSKVSDYRKPLSTSDRRGHLLSSDVKLKTLEGSLDKNNKNDSSYAIISQIDKSNIANASVYIKLEKSKLSEAQRPVVIFDLYNKSDGIPLTSVSKSLDYMMHIRIFRLPLIPPVVTFTKQTGGLTSINVKQIDKNADAINVFYKKIYGSTITQPFYTKFDKLSSMSYGNESTVSVLTPTDYPIVYRFIPSKNDKLGHEYTNIVLLPKKFNDMNGISIYSKCLQDGIEVSLTNLPPSSISLTLCRRDSTIFEKTWSNVGDPNVVNVDDSRDQVITVTDKNLIPGHIYEYSAIVQYDSGVKKRCGSEIVEYVSANPGNVKLTTKNTVIENIDKPTEDINVKFDVSLSLEDTDQTTLLSFLDAAGTQNYYGKELSEIKEKFNNLLTCTVHRINITTGMREKLGVLNKDNKDSFSFSEKERRDIFRVSPPERGSKYRYVVSALLRDVSTMNPGDAEGKTIDKKSYRYDPQKFFHPKVLSTGTVLTGDGGLKTYSKSQFEFGELGLFKYVDLDLTNHEPAIKDLSVNVFDRNTHIISWFFTGSPESIDHFLVAKNVLGLQTFLGKVHTQSNSDGNYSYYYNFDKPDVGEIKYVIIPVYNNYAVGSSSETSKIVVEST